MASLHSVPASSARVSAPASARAAPRSTRAVARRRSALLGLARRHGEVRLRIGDGRAAPAGAAEVSELLDELNEAGQLRWGGLRDAPDGRELIYLLA